MQKGVFCLSCLLADPLLVVSESVGRQSDRTTIGYELAP